LLAIPLLCSGVARDVGTDSLIRRGLDESRRRNLDKVALTARELTDLGRKTGDKHALLYGDIYMGRSLSGEANDSVHIYYNRAIRLAAELQDNYALATINNALAIYASELEMNPTLGISYFMKALDYARLSGDERIYYVVLTNLAMVYYRRGDTSGLLYSREVLDAGIAGEDPFLIYYGAVITANMYYLMKDYPTALHYVEMSIGKGGEYIDPVEAYSLYANILVKLGREEEAVGYYRRSLEHIGQDRSNTLAYLNYGSYLVEKGDYPSAIDMLERGLEFINERNNAYYRYKLYEKLSEAYERSGALQRAFNYYKKFHVETDSIFNVGRERAINEFRAKYEYEKQAREIQNQKLAIMSQRQTLNITIFVIVLLVGVSVVLFISYRNKNRRYRRIVLQQRELIEKEKRLDALSEKYTLSALSQERGQSLFEEFEKLIRVDKIYHDSGITIEKVAKMLGTNRSYLSKVINENSGGTFLQYIASARIDEARRILSDPANDVQIKTLAYDLGFSTPETFSSSFRSAIGMLPSIFREEMRKIDFGKTTP
jgi:AraC-like DNA-binding protein/Tfp pilus assembly protein PilF